MSLSTIRKFARLQNAVFTTTARIGHKSLVPSCELGGRLGVLYHMQQRHFFLHWINSVFNRVSQERIKEVGPDRACAEWLLRNGAFVQWRESTEFITDYNDLPLTENERGQFYIKAVDATDSSIMAMGFPHFNGCNHIEKIVLKKCKYLNDDALPLLSVLNNSLTHLEIVDCWNLTSDGILSLSDLSNLKILKLEGLVEIENKAAVENNLKKALPHCSISFERKTM